MITTINIFFCNSNLLLSHLFHMSNYEKQCIFYFIDLQNILDFLLILPLFKMFIL